MLINIDVFIIERESLWRLLVDTKKILRYMAQTATGILPEESFGFFPDRTHGAACDTCRGGFVLERSD